MVQAYILIQTEVGKARDVAASINNIDGVTRADAVTGPYDVIASVEAKDLDTLGDVVVSEVQQIRGITRTSTCTAITL